MDLPPPLYSYIILVTIYTAWYRLDSSSTVICTALLICSDNLVRRFSKCYTMLHRVTLCYTVTLQMLHCHLANVTLCYTQCYTVELQMLHSVNFVTLAKIPMLHTLHVRKWSH